MIGTTAPKVGLGGWGSVPLLLRFRFGWGFFVFRRAIALSGERGVGRTFFPPSGWGDLPPFQRTMGAARVAFAFHYPPPPQPVSSGVRTERSLPPPFFIPSPVSLPWVGSGQRCPSVPPPGRPHPGVPHTPSRPTLFSTMASLWVCLWGGGGFFILLGL